MHENSILKAKVMSPKSSLGATNHSSKYRVKKKITNEDKKTSLFSL
jgi:hypothetical protein